MEQRAEANRCAQKSGHCQLCVCSVLEDGEAGLLAGLEEAGYIDGENLAITYYNAEGDRSTAIMIAKEVTGADYEMVLTLSTPVMQAVAGANTTTRRLTSLLSPPIRGAQGSARCRERIPHNTHLT